MNQHTLRSTLSVLGAVIGLAILNAPAWSADTARKGTPNSQRGTVKFNDIAVTKGERQQPGGTPAGQANLNNKNPDLTIVSPRDLASGQAAGISWSGSDGDDVCEEWKSPTKGQASGKPAGQNVTGGTIPVYWDLGRRGLAEEEVSMQFGSKSQPNGSAPTAGIMVCNGGPCFNPVDTSLSAPGNASSGQGITSPRDSQSGLPTGK